MAKKTPAVWKDGNGKTRLVWSLDDEIKAQFDGFQPDKKADAPAPATAKKND